MFTGGIVMHYKMLIDSDYTACSGFIDKISLSLINNILKYNKITKTHLVRLPYFC